MKIGGAGLGILRHYEQGPKGGPALKSYRCPAGVWTAGYGHTRGVHIDTVCTPEQAEQWLIEDASEAENLVTSVVDVPLTQKQFDALVCLAFNIGAQNFKNSTLLVLLNERFYARAAEQFRRWTKARIGGVLVELEGLRKRREDERTLFLTP